MTSGRNRNEVWALALADELVRAGVREVVLSPGSRSTPLVLAFARDSRVRITVQIDERCAGFTALGMGRASRRPALVLTTSGTAGANLYPAVVEAFQGEVPLLVLTADRPHRLRDSDANQAIDQLRLFGVHVRAFHEVAPPRVGGPELRHLRMLAGRAVASAVGAPAGPVHLNVPFDRPLEPVEVPGDIPEDFAAEHPVAASGRRGGLPFVRITPRRLAASPEDVEVVASLLASSLRPLLVAGPLAEAERVGPLARELSRRSGIPLLADPHGGARWGGQEDAPVLGGYDLLLRDPELRRTLRPDLVLRLGASPTSAALGSFLEECTDARQVVVDAGHRWKDHLAVARDYLSADPVDLLERLPGESDESAVRRVEGWTRRWMSMERVVRRAVADGLRGPFFEGTAVAEAAAAAGDGVLFVSNSMPVRDLDAFVPPGPVRLRVVGNRGASGIDGIVSTALGVALGGDGPVVAVLGDLALYHDLNGLLAVRNVRPDLVFVVIHNDGGGIFHFLPIREHEPAFTPFFATPHGLDFSRAAALYDLPYREVEAAPGNVFRAVSDARATGGPHLLVVRTLREENRRRRNALVAEVGAQLRKSAAPA